MTIPNANIDKWKYHFISPLNAFISRPIGVKGEINNYCIGTLKYFIQFFYCRLCILSTRNLNNCTRSFRCRRSHCCQFLLAQQCTHFYCDVTPLDANSTRKFCQEFNPNGPVFAVAKYDFSAPGNSYEEHKLLCLFLVARHDWKSLYLYDVELHGGHAKF